MKRVFSARSSDVTLTPYTAALFTRFDNYLAKVDPGLGRARVVTSNEPDYASLADAALVVVMGVPRAKVVRRLEKRAGLHRAFSGAVATAKEGDDVVAFTLFDRWDPRTVVHRPSSFDVLVVVTAFNEADVIEQLLDRLTTGAIRVHVIDNWSTDATAEILARFASRGRVTWEEFPAEGASGHFELERLLRRVEEVAADSGADWVIHHDADEIREAPWAGVSLIDALWAVEQWGYNCIDHTVFNFRPVDNSWSPGDDLASSFPWCQFGDTPADFLQIKGWKPQSTRLSMADNAGHQVKFEGRRVFPYKFLLRHYSIRSQAHGERKILRERQPRWSPEERAKGWHVHYDHYNEETSFLWDHHDLLRWDAIDDHHLLERLSGVGMPNNPWDGEGPVTDP
jgi:glycosyltransferase involved in cell wall biosynthesis